MRVFIVGPPGSFAKSIA